MIGSIRVLVVDDHPLTRTGISAILRQQPDIEVVGEAGEAFGAMASLRNAVPDVAVLDLRLGASRSDGIELAQAMLDSGSDVRIVLYSNYVADLKSKLLEGSNIFGLVLKTDHPKALVDAVRAAAGRVNFVSPEVSARSSGR